jgi:hypothetical protein
MQNKYQHGELSLLWTAALVGLVALIGLCGLLSMRYERNLLMDALSRFGGSQAVQQTRQAAESVVAAESGGVRKCVVAGKTMYSNVDCDERNGSSRKVELHDPRGIEAPKLGFASASTEVAPSLQEQMIEKAVRK